MTMIAAGAPEGERNAASDMPVIQAAFWVCVNVDALVGTAHLCTTCVRTGDERETSVRNPLSLRITL